MTFLSMQVRSADAPSVEQLHVRRKEVDYTREGLPNGRLPQLTSALLRPAAYVLGEPNLAHRQFADGLRKVGPLGELEDASTTDAEHLADLVRAHEIHSGEHRRQRSRRLMTRQVRSRLDARLVRGAILSEARTDAQLLRFMLSHYVPLPNECWIFTGNRTPACYGRVRRKGVQTPAHRAHWEIVRGPLPPEVHVDHLCHETLCINLAHLDPVNVRENVVSRSFGITAQNANKAFCGRGHPFDEDNTYVAPGTTKRMCKLCARINKRIRNTAQSDVPFRTAGHGRVRAESGEQRCKCGLYLADREWPARMVMQQHRKELWAELLTQSGFEDAL